MTRGSTGRVWDAAALTRLQFQSLRADDQHAAIRHMVNAGHGDHTIAEATGLSVEFVRQIIWERHE
jgi:hypothetical protein